MIELESNIQTETSSSSLIDSFSAESNIETVIVLQSTI